MNQTPEKSPSQSSGQAPDQSFPNSPNSLQVYLHSLAPAATPVRQTWVHNKCRFKFITKTEGGIITEARYGGKMLCPMCPTTKEITNLSNLVSHLVSKPHALNYYQIQTLSRDGDESAKELYEFYNIWETRNNLDKLKAQRMRKNLNPAVANWSWEQTKQKFKCVEEYTTRRWNEIREQAHRKLDAQRRECELAQKQPSADPNSGVGNVVNTQDKGEKSQNTEPATAIIATITGGQKKVSSAFKKGKPNSGPNNKGTHNASTAYQRGEKRKAGPTEGMGSSEKRPKHSNGARPFASPGGRRGKNRSKGEEYIPPSPPPGSPPRTPPPPKGPSSGIVGPHSAPY
ncbi:hypothetical protein TWF694_011007 [Orbilia ellipsospora]|uniref:Uncharacterized protein n=1 Tax=Orbilia ellipsospora TaxID=2528407 RepID=A0AAV9X8V8_9PEZI